MSRVYWLCARLQFQKPFVALLVDKSVERLRRHLLLVVLTLVFATGSLNYDLLHFGYLAFSLVFFRMRGQIMERGNAILNHLRLYNFLLIIASLVYQAPAFEYKTAGSCSLPYDIWNIIGLYKYEYGEHFLCSSAE